MLEKDLDLVRNIAWSYKRSTPEFEFETLFSEGCVVYLEAEKEYDESKSKGTLKSTYIWESIQNHFNNLTLSNRSWICPKCNIKHDRDINASKNILIKGMDSILKSSEDINISLINEARI